MKEGYTSHKCRICRRRTNFKYLPHKQDVFGRYLMVCTSCSGKIAIPGQRKPTWKEMLERN
jgi:hypothetical protein